MYRVYQAILQSRKQTRINRDTVQCHSLPPGENNSGRNKLQNGRKRFFSESTTPFIVSDSTCEQDKLDHSQMNTCLDTDPVIQEEYDATDDSDVRVFMTHVEVVNELQN